MKALSLIGLCFLIMVSVQCSDTDSSEFEQASGIMLPAGAKQLDSYDDGKFVKTNAYSIDSDILEKFIQQHRFEIFNATNTPQFWGINNIEEKPNFTNLEGFYYKTGISGNLSWIYIADLKSGRLWTEIKYPGKPAY